MLWKANGHSATLNKEKAMSDIIEKANAVNLTAEEKADAARVTQTYTTMHAFLNDLTPDQVLWAIKVELEGNARARMLSQLHGRYSSLKAKAEREKLLSHVGESTRKALNSRV